MLGNTGLEVTVAGFGVLPMGPSQLALPVEAGAAILRYALEQGINFIDTAQYYQTYPYIRTALAGGAYDHVVLCSKSRCDDYDGGHRPRVHFRQYVRVCLRACRRKEKR